MLLNGISIADPAKMNRRELLNEHYTVELKEPGRPQGPFASEQTVDNRFQRSYPTSDGINSTVEVTVPVTAAVREQLESGIKLERYNDLHADVEKPILEADKNIHDTMKAGAWFDPKSVNPPQFKETVRPVYKFIPKASSKLGNPYNVARQFNYVYNYLNPTYGNRGYQKFYYANNTYKDNKGRIHLFDNKPFVRTFA
jgi:hypothetical protein